MMTEKRPQNCNGKKAFVFQRGKKVHIHNWLLSTFNMLQKTREDYLLIRDKICQINNKLQCCKGQKQIKINVNINQ